MAKDPVGKRPLLPASKQRWKVHLAKLSKSGLGRWAMRTVVPIIVPRQRVGVAVVHINTDEEVFMLRHVFHTNYEWGLPGGWLKRDEPPDKGALRELREETGLTAVLGPVVTVQHSRTPPHIGIVFLGQINQGTLQLSHEIVEARWCPLDALPQPLTSHTQIAIAAAVETFRNKQ